MNEFYCTSLQLIFFTDITYTGCIICLGSVRHSYAVILLIFNGAHIFSTGM